jgi:hypothetical protein
MSSKVVEADAGIHSLAMAVAVRFFPAVSHALMYMSSFFAVCALIQPVTSWRLYGMKFPLLSIVPSPDPGSLYHPSPEMPLSTFD